MTAKYKAHDLFRDCINDPIVKADLYKEGAKYTLKSGLKHQLNGAEFGKLAEIVERYGPLRINEGKK